MEVFWNTKYYTFSWHRKIYLEPQLDGGKLKFHKAHLLGIFENVANVEFNPKDYNRIDAVLSREGEKVS